MDALHGGFAAHSFSWSGVGLMEKHDLSFWLAVLGAAGVKLLTSEYAGFLKALATVMAAIFSGVMLTEPAMHILGLDPTVYTIPMAILMGLTGENLMRWVMGLTGSLPSDPGKILDLLKRWTGK